MSGVEGFGDFNAERQQCFNVQRPSGNAIFQRGAFQKFHGDKGLALFLANVVNGADVGMVQGRRRLRLPLETRQRLCVFGYIVGQKFQRHEAVQPGVFSFIDNAHATAAKFLSDAVVRNGLSDARGRVRHWPHILVFAAHQVNAARLPT